MSLSQQQSLLDTERGGAIVLETNGRVIRPLLNVIGKLVDECKIRADDDGLSIRAVDPANVAMVEIEAPAKAFDEFKVEGDGDVVVGANLSKLSSVLQDARMRQHDPDEVRLRLGTSVISAEIEREYVDTTVTRTDEFLAIDSDSVRQEPDLVDLDLPWVATMDVSAMSDTVAHLDTLYSHVAVRASSDGLQLSATGDKDGDNNVIEAASATIEGTMDNVDDDSGAVESMFSMDYMADVVAGAKASKTDTLQIHVGEEFPVRIEFARTDGDGDLLYDGAYMVAPRLASDD